jgi:hypothetical protein
MDFTASAAYLLTAIYLVACGWALTEFTRAGLANVRLGARICGDRMTIPDVVLRTSFVVYGMILMYQWVRSFVLMEPQLIWLFWLVCLLACLLVACSAHANKDE